MVKLPTFSNDDRFSGLLLAAPLHCQSLQAADCPLAPRAHHAAVQLPALYHSSHPGHSSRGMVLYGGSGSDGSVQGDLCVVMLHCNGEWWGVTCSWIQGTVAAGRTATL